MYDILYKNKLYKIYYKKKKHIYIYIYICYYI